MNTVARFLIGPPVGGALYSRFGFHGPCIFGIIAAVLDLVGRLIVIERKEALHWNHDPLSIPDDQESNVHEPSSTLQDSALTVTNEGIVTEKETQLKTDVRPTPSPSLFFVIVQLAKSSRAIIATSLTFLYA